MTCTARWLRCTLDVPAAHRGGHRVRPELAAAAPAAAPGTPQRRTTRCVLDVRRRRRRRGLAGPRLAAAAPEALRAAFVDELVRVRVVDDDARPAAARLLLSAAARRAAAIGVPSRHPRCSCRRAPSRCDTCNAGAWSSSLSTTTATTATRAMMMAAAAARRAGAATPRCHRRPRRRTHSAAHRPMARDSNRGGRRAPVAVRAVCASQAHFDTEAPEPRLNRRRCDAAARRRSAAVGCRPRGGGGVTACGRSRRC